MIFQIAQIKIIKNSVLHLFIVVFDFGKLVIVLLSVCSLRYFE